LAVHEDHVGSLREAREAGHGPFHADDRNIVTRVQIALDSLGHQLVVVDQEHPDGSR
jgi:hypothetical protein